MSARQAAARFGVGVTTAFVWIRRFRANGEARSAAARQAEAVDKDISLAEIAEWLEAERGLCVGDHQRLELP